MLIVKVKGVEYKIGFKHVKFERDEDAGFVPMIRGYTRCHVFTLDLLCNSSAALALCSIKDNFSRATGRKISLGRALLKAFPDKEDRRYVWEQYFRKLEDDRKKSKAAQAKKVLVFRGEEHVLSEVK